jgi:hypothetical protein
MVNQALRGCFRLLSRPLGESGPGGTVAGAVAQDWSGSVGPGAITIHDALENDEAEGGDASTRS